MKYLLKCMKFYFLMSVWNTCYNINRLQNKIEDLSMPLYEDPELQGFIEWYWKPKK